MFAPFFSRLSCFFPACVLQFLLVIAVGFHMFSHLFWVFSYVRERQERRDTRDTYPPCRPPLLAWALQLEPLWLWPFRRRSASRCEFNELSYIYWKTITFRRCQFHLFSQDTFRTLLVEFQWFSRVRPTLDQFDLVQQQAGTQCTQVTIARVRLRPNSMCLICRCQLLLKNQRNWSWSHVLFSEQEQKFRLHQLTHYDSADLPKVV